MLVTLAMNALSDELPVELLARAGVVRAVAGALLGHDIELVKLEQTDSGADRCEVLRCDPVVMPRWDGIVIDLAVKHMSLGCQPCFKGSVPESCKTCIANVATQQAVLSQSRVHAQDVCEDAFHLIVGRDEVVNALTRELLLHRELSGQQIARALWPTGDPVAAARYRC